MIPTRRLPLGVAAAVAWTVGGTRLRRGCGYALFLLLALAAIPALAQPAPEAGVVAGAVPAADTADEAPDIATNTFAIMAGIYTTSFWARSFSFNNVGYEPNYVIALISGKDLITTSWGLRIGHESGIALRFGADFSVEMWRGITISFGARLVGRIRLTPELVLGLSSISNAIGVEVGREAAVEDGDIDRLIYLGSQVAWMFEDMPFLEFYYRLHHRSGALGFWGNVPDGHNANSVGITFRY